jgi:hypothetical protein
VSASLVNWLVPGAYAAGWFVTGRLAWRWMNSDGKAVAADRFAAGFLGLFWPLALWLALVAGIVLLPTLQWQAIRRGGETAGWRVARWRLGRR